MMTVRILPIVAFALVLPCCSDTDSEAAAGNRSAPAAEAQSQAVEAPRDVAPEPCPVRLGRDWYAQVKGSRLAVFGEAETIMAGFSPVLRRRSDNSAQVIRLDLELQQESGAAVEPVPVRYEQQAPRRAGRVELYCGAKAIRTIAIDDLN